MRSASRSSAHVRLESAAVKVSKKFVRSKDVVASKLAPCAVISSEGLRCRGVP
jgi:hypothetical protein